ncbi:uncharacterized protein LOC132610758 [Lycium barbarum]|uniref:uncharacterized protein LOC132610758 n=1 Tax=Lycium barbarum TaxID=112863 RepID=UPI00293EB1F4|nr:uncharacterized protein LOC132610758 [Lycium barbarum]
MSTLGEKFVELKVEDENSKKVENGKEESSGYDPDDWLTWPNKDVFIKYYQQLRESEGFDFDEYPGSCMFAPIYPILGFERHPEYVARIKGYASMAIKKYYRKRKDGKERKVKEIVKINAGGPSDFNFYITFKIDNAGKEEIFQAKVVILIDDTIEIPICRRKKV